jgi:hypothetical protein
VEFSLVMQLIDREPLCPPTCAIVMHMIIARAFIPAAGFIKTRLYA